MSENKIDAHEYIKMLNGRLNENTKIDTSIAMATEHIKINAVLVIAKQLTRIADAMEKGVTLMVKRECYNCGSKNIYGECRSQDCNDSKSGWQPKLDKADK